MFEFYLKQLNSICYGLGLGFSDKISRTDFDLVCWFLLFLFFVFFFFFCGLVLLVYLLVQLLGHLKLPAAEVDSWGYSKRATPASRSGTAEHLAPEPPPGRLTEMNCFDPNWCACLRFDGSS